MIGQVLSWVRARRPEQPCTPDDRVAEVASPAIDEMVTVTVDELNAVLDGLAPDVMPWLPDLPAAVVPELVIRIPIEGVPRAQFEDGSGKRVSPDARMRDWLVAARACGTLYVNACTVAEVFAALDAERLEGGQPGRLYDGCADE